MNRTLLAAFLRQRFTSPMRLALALLFTFFPLVGVAITGQYSVLTGMAMPLALVFAAGAIGQDVSSGTLQLLLVRPVTRPSYLLHRWLGASLAAYALNAVTLALGALILVLRGSPPAPLELVRLLLETATAVFGHAAVMVLFSTLAGGLGDLGLYVGSLFVFQLTSGMATFLRSEWLARACNEVLATLGPQVSLAGLPQGSPPSWFAVVSWASTVTLALAAGIARLNRRELSYAAD